MHTSEHMIIIMVTLMLILLSVELQAGVVKQIDPYPLQGTRKIPDITGSPGDSVTLFPIEIIDILLLGDGYKSTEQNLFFSNCTTWYLKLFDADTGIRPYNLFSQAFRVRAIYNSSSRRADTARQSYYKVKIDVNGEVVTSPSWWDDNTAADQAFRDSVFSSVVSLTNPAVNPAIYPPDLDNRIGGVQVIEPLKNLYSNLTVAMLILSASRTTNTETASGVTFSIQKTGGTQRIRCALGVTEEHEFQHAFAYLQDEYITKQGQAAGDGRRNPTPAELSVFNLSNLSFSNGRCDMLWPHLAPDGRYNSNVSSLIGNLFIGGDTYEKNVWHSEYKCLVNGQHANYLCDISNVDSVDLRDYEHLCFWCEEIVALRILEKTLQLARATDPGDDWNAMGRVWYALWDTALRYDYYTFFNIDSLIAEKNKCYAIYLGSSQCATCLGDCDTLNRPTGCLSECDIREIGNAIYVSTSGVAGGDGSKADPRNTPVTGAALACSPGYLVAFKPGTYPGPYTITQRATLIPEGCISVVIGSASTQVVSQSKTKTHSQRDDER